MSILLSSDLINKLIYDIYCVGLKKLKNDIERTLNFLREGTSAEARAFFNTNIGKNYEKELAVDNKYFQLKMFLMELDDYLNDKTVKIIGSTNLEELNKSYLDINL